MKLTTPATIILDGRKIDYRVVRSKAARKLRVRVGPSGVEVVQPATRANGEVDTFLHGNADWILGQMDRVERLQALRKPPRKTVGEILFRGTPTPVRVQEVIGRRGPNKVTLDERGLTIITGKQNKKAPSKSLENWLRRQAREEITKQLTVVTSRLKRSPRKVFVMNQRTKWGNCSALQNLSFNWRLILAPDFVLRYLVTHEAAHLAVPDHSRKFWLTVQSHCRETERARQWLCANADKLLVDLDAACSTN
jgi:predicted metal-dependent hydrolase